MYKFITIDDGEITAGELLYRKAEFSLDYIQRGMTNIETYSLSINTLQIEVDFYNKRLLYVWGYFPLLHSENGRLVLPNYRLGGVRLISDIFPKKGMAYDLLVDIPWIKCFDIDSGWMYFGSSQYINDQPDVSIKFASDTIISLVDEMVVALWMRPKIVTTTTPA